MRPIPKWMLTHSAKLYSEKQHDSWQKTTWDEPVTLRHVRIEYDEALIFGVNNQQYRRTAVLFFDVRNSKPVGTTFYRGQKLTAFGRDFRVEKVEPLYDERGLHHYEVSLL